MSDVATIVHGQDICKKTGGMVLTNDAIPQVHKPKDYGKVYGWVWIVLPKRWHASVILRYSFPSSPLFIFPTLSGSVFLLERQEVRLPAEGG
eukprot:295838-Pelagomonas_calceolata.AAC.6